MPFDLKQLLSKVTLEQVLREWTLAGTTPSPWAVILVKFRDNQSPLPAMTIYEDLFTSKGIGKQNMVDFFRDMSHGNLDLSGSKIFGWYTLPYNIADYVGNGTPGAGQIDRGGLVNQARTLATAAGVDLSQFAGVVVSCLGAVDLCGFVGGMAAICDSLSLQPSLLGQEMGHGYGLDHARQQGSTDDYRDPWDVMSTAAYPYMEANDAEFTKVGPGLNAWNMRGRGWLDESRVWSPPSGSWGGPVELRPLHRRDLPGNLAAQLGNYLIEFRVPQRWDAAISSACVLVHRFEGNHSYVMSATSGRQGMLVGDKFTTGNPAMVVEPFGELEVTGIDMKTLTATLNISVRPAFREPSLVATMVSEAVKAGGEGIVWVGGHLRVVPPHSPAMQLLKQVDHYLSLEPGQSDVASSMAAQRAALADVVRALLPLYAEAEIVSDHPPGYRGEHEVREG